MASEIEIRKEQKRQLFQLLMIVRDLKEPAPKRLLELIQLTKTEMLAEDVAYVEQNLTEI